MSRGPAYSDSFNPRLSGHETFPLRYGWLKKAFDAVYATEDEEKDNRFVFSGSDAIAKLGVGRNMVVSMRHWATASRIIEDKTRPNRIATTCLGNRIFGPDGLDPYMENIATSWLVHWQLAGWGARSTTWLWAFNYYSGVEFQRENLARSISKFAEERRWKRIATSTIKRDVACLISTYVPRSISALRASHEERLESPLIELGLVRSLGVRDSYRFVRGPKPSLGLGVLAYAITDFWKRSFRDSSTLSFEALAHEPGSPGQVFLLDENEMVEMLSGLEVVTDGDYVWSESSGLKQLVRRNEVGASRQIDFIGLDYASRMTGVNA